VRNEDFPFVPAQAGTQGHIQFLDLSHWVPAFAGTNGQTKRPQPPARSGGATVASVWLLRLSASATKPDAFTSSTNVRT